MGTQVVSLITGVIFGACLVLAGFTDPDRVIRALRLKDFHIIRSVILILLIAILGTWLIIIFGTVEIVNKPAAIVTLTIGGLLFGAGMGFTGYTPATSFAGAASGRIDALFAILGMFFGAYVYVFIYPPAIKHLEIILNYGIVTLPEITHIHEVIWIIFFSLLCLIALFVTMIKSPVTNSISAKNQENNLSDIDISELLSNEEGYSINTDFFDSAQILRTWKNIFFSITIICMMLLQFFFWIVIQSDTNIDNSSNFLFGITSNHISMILNISNIILIFSTIFYVAMIFFCLSVSFSTNMGGLKYVSMAFFSALVALVLLFPWQILFGHTLPGVIYTPSELLVHNFANPESSVSVLFLYLRFVGYWGIAIFLLIRSQVYTRNWMNIILGKIEQII